MHRSVKLSALVTGIVFASITGFLWYSDPGPLNVQLQGVRTYDPRMAMPAFTLQDYRGQPFGTANLRNKWTLLFFGYTQCPDVCPTTLYALATALKALPASARQQIQVVFVSVDPARDTAAGVGQFVAFFDKDFIGVTGHTPTQLHQLTGPLNVSFEVPATTPADANYQVDHNANVLLIDPAARLVADIAPPQAAATVEALLRAVFSHYRVEI